MKYKFYRILIVQIELTISSKYVDKAVKEIYDICKIIYSKILDIHEKQSHIS